MLSALIQKLDLFGPLSDEARNRLRKLPARLLSFAPHDDIVREKEPRGDVRVICEGIAARTKSLDGGDRQAVLGFVLPGEVDESDPLADALDHGIVALSPVKVALLARQPFDQLLLEFPDLARAFRRMARLNEGITRMWLANMGQRAADRQTAHLLCEMQVRLCAVGMGGADWFTNPLTQEQFANVLGISAVHMNRVMQHLRELGLIRIENHTLRFPSLARIHEYAGFDPAYLVTDARVRAHEQAAE